MAIYKMVEMDSLGSSAAVQLVPVLLSYLLNLRPGAVIIRSSQQPHHHSHLLHCRRSLRQRLDHSGRSFPLP